MREIVVLVLLLAGILCACGCTAPGPAGTTAVNTPSPAPVATLQAAAVSNGIVKNVIIRQRAFDPNIITISPGTTVVWTNEDSMSHRVVHLPQLPSEQELFHSDPLPNGGTFSYTFQQPGEYYYGDPQLGSGRSPKVIVK